jgi:uncharacterized protein with HEPN domain
MGDAQRLEHILQAISEIENYISGVSEAEFLDNSMMRFASIKQIEIIGEAANYISAETKSLFTDLQWSQIVGMRHILVHEYFGIDVRLIWQIILKDIPDLKQKIMQIRSHLK